MAAIATHLLDFPPEGQISLDQYHSRIRSFVDSLNKTDGAKILKADEQQDFLQVLNPSVNSISYLYILLLRYKVFFRSKSPTPTEARTLLFQALNFLQQLDSIQIRYAGDWLTDIIDQALNIATHINAVSHLSAAFVLHPC
jgi:COP9 signalosome complex subunit 3